MIIIYTFRRRSLCKWNGKILPGYQRVCRRNPSTKCNWIFDGQLTNRGTSELTYQFALRINGSENS